MELGVEGHAGKRKKRFGTRGDARDYTTGGVGEAGGCSMKKIRKFWWWGCRGELSRCVGKVVDVFWEGNLKTGLLFRRKRWGADIWKSPTREFRGWNLRSL